MDFSLEQIVRAVDTCAAANTSEELRSQATLYLEQLKHFPQLTNVALQLLSSSAISLQHVIFAMQLLRYHLNSSSHTISTRGHIRQSLLQRIYLTHTTMEGLVAKSIANILTICLKWEYPEAWSTAFDDIFTIAQLSPLGTHIAVHILYEIDMEIVVFDEKRSVDEVSHNVIIKDEMRQGSPSVVQRIVEFLCLTSASSKATDRTLCLKCLDTLVEYIGWIDIALIVNNSVLTFLYTALQSQDTMPVTCKCLQEVVKKGMDVENKLGVLESMQLLPVLLQIPLTSTSAASSSTQHVYEELGVLVDAVFLTLIGYWQKREETLLTSASETDPLVTLAATMMNSLFPLVLNLFHFPHTQVSCTVMPSLNRFASLLKQQLKHQAAIATLLQTGHFPQYFLADQFTNKLLMAIYRQIQFNSDFTFDIDDDDDAVEIEAKKEVRKLFINCCRVKPQSCLELVVAAFGSLVQPLSSSAFSPLEASLRLLYAFGECGAPIDPYTNSAPISGIIRALHQSDVCAHPHSQVLIAYFDVTARYTKQSDDEGLYRAFRHMAGQAGLRHKDSQVRSRCAYMMLKLVESMEVRKAGSIVALLPVIATFEDLLFQEPSSRSWLADESVLCVVETIGLVVASNVTEEVATEQGMQLGQYVTQQHMILSSILQSVSSKISRILLDPQSQRYTEDFADMIAHAIDSLSCATKGFSKKKIKSEFISTFLQLFDTVTAALDKFDGFPLVRQKTIVFLHRMLNLVGTEMIPHLHRVIPLLLVKATVEDMESIVYLVNQIMTEYGAAVVFIVDAILFPLLDRVTPSNVSSEQTVLSAIESQRVALIKLYLSFITHMFSSGCHPAMYSPTNLPRAHEVYDFLVQIIAEPSTYANKESHLLLLRSVLSAFIEICKQWKAMDASTAGYHLNRRFLVEILLPLLLLASVDGSLNIKDAQTFAAFGDIGVLLCGICEVQGPDAIIFYIQTYQSQGWTANKSNAVVQLMANKVPIHVFRDEFKRIMKSIP